MSSIATTKSVGQSRAVQRHIQAGSSALCAGCEEAVKFATKVRRHQIIANVYDNGRWNRVEHYHPECYAEAGEPHGPVRTEADQHHRR